MSLEPKGSSQASPPHPQGLTVGDILEAAAQLGLTQELKKLIVEHPLEARVVTETNKIEQGKTEQGERK